MTTIKERVLQMLEYKGVIKESFFDKLGISYGNFKGKSKKTALSSNVLADITTTFPDVNPTWLLTGQGEMLVGGNTNTVIGNNNGSIQGDVSTYKEEAQDDIARLERTITEQKSRIKALEVEVQLKDKIIALMEAYNDNLKK